MTEADFDHELRRILLGFGAAIALFVVLYLFRTFKVYVLGRRYSGVIAKVVKKEAPKGETGYKATYSYVVEYEDIRSGRSLAHESTGVRMGFQEFEVGDRVTIFLQEGQHKLAEILSWRRLLVSAFVIVGVAVAMYATYYFLLGRKNA